MTKSELLNKIKTYRLETERLIEKELKEVNQHINRTNEALKWYSKQKKF